MAALGMTKMAAVTIGLGALVASHTVRADPSGARETCASEHPDILTEAPKGYHHKGESAAFNAFAREAKAAGYTRVQKTRRDKVRDGPCVDDGEHVNISGARTPAKGKPRKWGNIGSMTSCDICEDTPRGPKLGTVWRLHPNF